MELEKLMVHISIIPDYRHPRKVEHKLSDILLLTICAVISGAEGWDLYCYPLNPISGVDRLRLVDINLVPTNNPLHNIVDNINVPKTFTVGAHGEPYYILSDSGNPLSPKSLEDMIKLDHNYRKGESVKLIACNTANGGSGSFASLLAKELNINMTGAEGYYADWCKRNKDGSINVDSILMVPVKTQQIGKYGVPIIPNNIGSWITFGPNG